MLKSLNKPYPYYFNTKRNLIVASIVGIFVGGLNLLLINEILLKLDFTYSKETISILFGSITFCSIFIVFQTSPKLFFGKFSYENWMISKEIRVISFLHLVILIINFNFIVFISKDPFQILTVTVFSQFAISTLLIGLIPSIFIIWIDYTLKLKANLKQAQQHNKNIEKIQSEKDTFVNLHDILKINKDLSIDINQLLFIKSDGNYVDIFINNNRNIEKVICRISIQQLEIKFSQYDHIISTHRSFIVNLKNIKHTQGNARNYQLFFDLTDLVALVSRSKFQAFNLCFQNILTIRNK